MKVQSIQSTPKYNTSIPNFKSRFSSFADFFKPKDSFAKQKLLTCEDIEYFRQYVPEKLMPKVLEKAEELKKLQIPTKIAALPFIFLSGQKYKITDSVYNSLTQDLPEIEDKELLGR